MKKLFALLLALVVVSGAFAQLTVTGYVRSTAFYNAKETVLNGESGTVTGAERLRLNIDNKDADGNWGFTGRFQVSPTTGLKGAGVVVTDYLYGWAKFAGGMGKASLGYLDNTDYHFSQNTNAVYLGNGNVDSGTEFQFDGMGIQFTPTAGLSVGAFYQPNGGKLLDKAAVPAGAFNQLAFGASYAVEKLLNVKTGWWNLGDNKLKGQIGVEYVGMENLDAVVGLKMNTAPDSNGDKENTIYSIVEYTTGPIFVDVAGTYRLKPAQYYFEGNVEYTGEGYKVRADVMYDKDAGVLGANYKGEVNKTSFGVELSLPFATKAEFNVGVNMLDKTGAKIPMFLKVSF